MIQQLIKSTGISAAILTIAMTQTAVATSMPTTINDTYVGGDDHGRGDVIGYKSKFDVLSMDVDLIGNSLAVTINTNFAGRAGIYSWATAGDEGIGYGDLFLSNSWNPFGSASDGYVDDNFYSVNTTNWSYAFSLDDRWDNNGGAGSLYSLTGDGSDVLLSEDFLSNGIFRDGQEIAVNTDAKEAINSSDWNITADTRRTVGSINFLIDLTGTSLEGSDTIALHWGMTCGNDTIEGEYTSVPEPAILGMLAIGLIGIGISQRKRKLRAYDNERQY